MCTTGWKRRWEILMHRDKVLSLIGLAMKAGRCISGETMTESETKSGRPIYIYGDKDTLGHAMGKEFRASLAILDEGFADGIQKELKDREDIA